MKTVSVKASKNYDIIIDSDFLDDAGTIIRDRVGGLSAAIVTDDNVESLYGERIEVSLKKAGYKTVKFVLPNGEASKNTNSYLSLVNLLAKEKFSRTDVVVAFGGGVPGDIAGFAAASYMRGTGFVQIPTTLLAAVDSSVGGKTAVNLESGKNQLGAFYQPDIVLCDVSLLSTLPPEVYKDGCAEIIKYGIIADKELFKKAGGQAPCSVIENIEDVIYRCVKIKRDIVNEDEFEHGLRKLLNFGHTIGHAIEKLSDYNVSHGKAVAIGMAAETRAAVEMGICDKQCEQDVSNILDLFGLPQTTSYSAKDIARVCLSDKKRDGESLTIVLPEKIGKCILKKIPVTEVESLIKSIIGE